MKKISTIYLLTMLLLVLAIGCNDTQNDSPDKDDNIVTDGQNSENQEENNGGEQNEIQGDETVDKNSEGTVKFYIGDKDVVLDTGFDCINAKYKEIIKEFVRMSLLGYGGSESLEEIREINDRIFSQDSENREDYVTRMNAYVTGIHDNYLNGYSEVEFRGNLEKTNNEIRLKIRINHVLTCFDIQTGLAYDEITTSVKYTLVLTEKDEKVYIKSCIPDKRNDFDGEEGKREVSTAGRIIRASDFDMKVLESNDQISEEEKYVLREFYTELIYALGGYEYIEEVEAIHEELFVKESNEQYDYMSRIEKSSKLGMQEMRTEIRKVNVISGTEKERILEIDVIVYEYTTQGELCSAFANSYRLILKEIDNRTYIVSCIPHENNLYE